MTNEEFASILRQQSKLLQEAAERLVGVEKKPVKRESKSEAAYRITTERLAKQKLKRSTGLK